jgi:hypothetical protein
MLDYDYLVNQILTHIKYILISLNIKLKFCNYLVNCILIHIKYKFELFFKVLNQNS